LALIARPFCAAPPQAGGVGDAWAGPVNPIRAPAATARTARSLSQVRGARFPGRRRDHVPSGTRAVIDNVPNSSLTQRRRREMINPVGG
jgi:hypothetical protein